MIKGSKTVSIVAVCLQAVVILLIVAGYMTMVHEVTTGIIQPPSTQSGIYLIIIAYVGVIQTAVPICLLCCRKRCYSGCTCCCDKDKLNSENGDHQPFALALLFYAQVSAWFWAVNIVVNYLWLKYADYVVVHIFESACLLVVLTCALAVEVSS